MYTLAEHIDTNTYRIVSPFMFCPAPYADIYENLVTNVVGDGAAQRAAAVICGALGSGKSTLCIRSLAGMGFVPLAHQSVAEQQPLHIGFTIADWFKHCRVGDVAIKARELGSLLEENWTSRAALVCPPSLCPSPSLPLCSLRHSVAMPPCPCSLCQQVLLLQCPHSPMSPCPCAPMPLLPGILGSIGQLPHGPAYLHCSWPWAPCPEALHS